MSTRTTGLALLLLPLALVIACRGDDDDSATKVGVDDVLASPDQFEGEEVRVEGEVTAIIAGGIYVLDDGLLVADPTGDVRLARGNIVTLTGEVDAVDDIDFEDTVGLEPDRYYSLRDVIEGYDTGLVVSKAEPASDKQTG